MRPQVPHDWLLPQCSAAVHHGGAGTTAASLLWACPTTVVYFFGDQPFWGMACHKCGANELFAHVGSRYY